MNAGKSAQDKQKLRSRTLGCGLLTFVVGFIAFSGLCSQLVMFSYAMRQMGDYTDPNYRDSSTILHEVWLRQVIPGPLRRPCYSAESATCKAADGALRMGGVDATDSNFGFMLGASVLFAVFVAFVFWRFAGRRPRNQDELGSAPPSAAD